MVPTATVTRIENKRVRLSDEYYEYLEAIAKEYRRGLKDQLEVIILDWMEANDWEQP